jgi:F0F1-type ATP synthase membrane subunit a
MKSQHGGQLQRTKYSSIEKIATEHPKLSPVVFFIIFFVLKANSGNEQTLLPITLKSSQHTTGTSICHASTSVEFKETVARRLTFVETTIVL